MSTSSFSFKVHAPFEPAGDQIKAIEDLSSHYLEGAQYQTLLGVTGSGKTYTMAKVIEKIQKPALIISHNKTLSAQLYREFKEFFPENSVEYFVSYYDYYQPEAYVPSRDLYIEKDSSINEEIERLRLAATTALMERGDVIIVATVSAIYGLGNPETYKSKRIIFRRGETIDLKNLSRLLVDRLYERNDMVLDRGNFRIRGDLVEIFPPYQEVAYRLQIDWDELTSIHKFNPITLQVIEELDQLSLFPATHFTVDDDQLKRAFITIQEELEESCRRFEEEGKIVESQRLRSRTEYDLEMLRERGTCKGIENYTRHLNGTREGARPGVLLDYFQESFFTIIDESHVTIPQIGGMFNGDRARKETLVKYGFRLPSALDNRPLIYGEFDEMAGQTLFVSATPRDNEIEKSSAVIEQLIRPTGLLDPPITVRPTEGQIESLFAEIREAIGRNQRVLITTLTKKMAESFTDFLLSHEIKTRYLHSEIETIERVEIIQQLRTSEIDVVVGINLLREGLDIPEVGLVAIMDADKMGFLRSKTSLVQTIGRAARNSEGRVLMFADKESLAMRDAIDETNRRREIQLAYNKEHNITPKTIQKNIHQMLTRHEKETPKKLDVKEIESQYNLLDPGQKAKLLKALEKEMLAQAKEMQFEEAARLRDEIKRIRNDL